MKIYSLAALILFATQPALAQTRPAKDGSSADPCAPIGRTSDGRLVYGMTCTNLPAPPPRPGGAAAPSAAISPEPDVERSGIFGMSYTRKPQP